MNSIPDSNVSLFIVIGTIALASNVRFKVVGKLLKQFMRGEVVRFDPDGDRWTLVGAHVRVWGDRLAVPGGSG